MQKSSTLTETMVSLLLMSFMLIVLRNINLRISGNGAHHQNAHTEHAIQIIMYMARTVMLHLSLYWSEYGVDDLAL